MDRCGSYQADQWKTRIASGDIPHYIKTDAIGSGLHDIGAVRVLSEDYLRQHMPNYTKLVDQIAGPYGWQTVTSGGEVVGIPSVNVAIASGATFVTRRDWIEAVGEPIPDKRMLGSPYSDYSSLEDVERLLRKYRNEDPDGNGERVPTACRSTRTATPSVSTPAPSGHSRTSSARTACASPPGRRPAARCSTR